MFILGIRGAHLLLLRRLPVLPSRTRRHHTENNAAFKETSSHIDRCCAVHPDAWAQTADHGNIQCCLDWISHVPAASVSQQLIGGDKSPLDDLQPSGIELTMLDRGDVDKVNSANSNNNRNTTRKGLSQEMREEDEQRRNIVARGPMSFPRREVTCQISLP